MAFPLWSGDARLPSAGGSYFTSQALRAGYAVDPIARPDLAAPPPYSAREVLQRELQKERIHEEYLSRELAHSRLLLDQQMRRHQELEAARRIVPAPAYPLPVPEFRAVERPPVLAPHPIDLGFRERLPPPVPRFVDSGIDRRRSWSRPKPAFSERLSAALRPKAVIRKKPPIGRRAPSEHKVVSRNEVKLPKKASGVKRKADTIEAASDPPQQDKSKWSCSLCQVFATNEHDLKAHLNGKRHKSVQESHSSQTKIAGKADESEKADKLLPVKSLKDQEKQFFCCDVCKVKCTSQSMLDSHLSGKRHKEATVTSPAKEAGTTKEVITPVPMKKQKQAVKKKPDFKQMQVVQQSSLNCDVCNLKCNSEFMLNSHLNGKRHKAQLMQHNKAAQDDKPEDPKFLNEKLDAAEQTGKDNTIEGLGKGDKPVVSEESGKPVTAEESGKASTPVTAAKRRVVKKVMERSAVGKAAVEETVATGPADTQVSLVEVKKEKADTEVSMAGAEAAETTVNGQ